MIVSVDATTFINTETGTVYTDNGRGTPLVITAPDGKVFTVGNIAHADAIRTAIIPPASPTVAPVDNPQELLSYGAELWSPRRKGM